MNIKKYSLFVFVIIFLPIFIVFAETIDDSTKEEIFSSFKSKAIIENTDFVVPTVVEADIFNNDISRPTFAVYDRVSQNFISNLFVENYLLPKKPKEVRGISGTDLQNICDGKYETFSDFILSDYGISNETLRVQYNEPITTDALSIYLDRYVALPNKVSISYLDSAGKNQILVNRIEPSSTHINFPKITSNLFFIDLTFTQPLRISEISFSEKDINKRNVSSLRFLLQPNHDYEIYLNPDRNISIDGIGESPNLKNENVIKDIGIINIVDNDLYVKSDADNDGIPDEVDNCVNVPNSDQTDVDKNGRGDACDDFDQDGIINSKDNCVDDPNRRQIDTDNDGIGDICDPEESRITEKYPILVWGGIIFAVIVLLALYFVAFKNMKSPEVNSEEEKDRESDI